MQLNNGKEGFSPLKDDSMDWTKATTYSTIAGNTPVTIAVTDDGSVSYSLSCLLADGFKSS